MAMDAKELYLLSVTENGIGEDAVAKLASRERALLEKREDGKYWLSPAQREKFHVVLTGGVFDILHAGHALTLERAKGLGDLLVVVLTTDARVEQIKKRKPIHSAESRREALSKLKSVDLALVGKENMMDTFVRVRPDIVAFGYDQVPIELPGACKSVHLASVEVKGVKTSQLIRELELEGKAKDFTNRAQKPEGALTNPLKEPRKQKRNTHS